MSLINEALKKVQNQQVPPGSPNQSDPAPPAQVPPGQPQGHGRQRNFLWGFILAVLIVGLFTTMLTSFFVYQFLGDETDGNPPSDTQETVQETRRPTAAETDLPKKPIEPDPPSVTAPAQVQPPVVVTPEPPTNESPPPIEAPEVAMPSAILPPPVIPEAGKPEAEGTSNASGPASASLAIPPDPAVISRLQEIEIRGIMSGGIKVLIHDQATGLTRAYRVDEAMGGPMGLIISGITASTIQFRDYAGTIHTKSF